MSTVTQNLSLVRSRLGEPDRDALPDHQLFGYLADHLTQHSVQLANARAHWSVASWQLTATPGVEDYLVTANDFGRPFLVYTEDSQGSTFFVRSEVPFTTLQDADQRYVGPLQATSSYEHTAVACAFYFTAGQPHVRLYPTPGGTGLYRVWYETAPGDFSLGDTPGLQAFHNLVRVQTALTALPFCYWGEMRPEGKQAKAWEMRVKMLRDSLVYDEQKYQKEFDLFRHLSTREQVHTRLAYGDDYEDAWLGGGVGRLTDHWGV